MRVIDHRLRLAPGDPDDFTIVHHETPNQYGVMDEVWCQIHHYIDSRDPMEPVRFFISADARASAHLYVMRAHAIHQFVDFNRGAWHSGEAELDGRSDRYGSLNLCSIGIEFEGNGQLVRKNGVWTREWSGRTYSDDRVVECRHHRGGERFGWTTFTEFQVRMAIELGRLLSVYASRLVGHHDVSWPRKPDPGPLWPIEAIRRACKV